MNIPKDYPISKDLIDRRQGQSPTLADRARDLTIKVRNDWQTMKQEEKDRSAGNSPSPSSQDTKTINGTSYPSFKKGGKIKKTGLIYAHKGETVIPNRSKRSQKKREVKKK